MKASGVIALLLLATPACAGVEHLALADQLALDKRWDLAELEYRRILIEDPDTSARARAALGVTQSLRRTRPLPELIAWSQKQDFPPSIRDEVLLEAARGALDNRAGDRVYGLTSFVSQDNIDRVLLLRSVAASQSGQFGLAISELDSVPASSSAFATATDFRIRIGRERSRANLSPTAAAWLNVVPGLGYAYAASPQTGISAFVVNGVFGLATYQAFHHGQTALGWFMGAVTFSWYAGGIYGSHLTAARVNRFHREEFLQTLAY